MADQVAPTDWVKMRHPKVEKSQTCHPGTVSHWEKRGWKVVTAAPSPAQVKSSDEKKGA